MSARHRRRLHWPQSIRARLSVILAIPTILLISVAGAGVAAQINARTDADATARHVDLVLASQELVHSLQRERGLTVGLLGGEARFRTDLDGQRATTDKARTALNPLLADQTVPGVGEVRTALERLSSLASLRAAADARATTKQEAFGFFTTTIGAIIDASFSVDVGRSDPGLVRGLQALEALSRAKESTGQERATVNGAFAAGSFTSEEYVRFLEIRAAKIDAFDRFNRLGTQKQTGALSLAQQGHPATTTASMELRAVAGSAGQRLNVSPRAWYTAITAYIDALRDVQRATGDDVRALAVDNRERDTQRLVALVIIVVTLLLGAVLLAIVTSRAILRPLRQLTGEANDVAERGLPEAVARIQAAPDGEEPERLGFDSPLTARDDEFAEVAGALQNVHETAVRLAAEQAVLRRNTAESLANLGRRNQNLVRRQLGFITALERDESDPNALANLFELDHLATRMRRNAESLLVLVGERSPRRSSEPVAVGDVLRSALAEVEDYRRVVLRRVDDAMIRGPVVAEVAHLVAELVENALVFSPPDQSVEIQARMDGGEYHVAIVDQGLGMTVEELGTANARLRGEQSFLVAPTRYLGHYVVGRLAERLGVRVWLHESPLNGITARVVLPAELLVREAVPAKEPEQERVLVSVTPVPAPAPPPEPEPEPEAAQGTTANGLVRRVPRTRTHRRADEPVYAALVSETVPERSPERVRTMLDSFRSGVREGEEGR
ncbi:nitrate- and nitrite sensing domain-containing protein [Nonomuraea sp. NPDC050556]|uniref:sensor histidine kinase n=1 Tax=Nonomuraea sp. NPDC050556 TaxID=3364369 RepID=UPI00379B87CD